MYSKRGGQLNPLCIIGKASYSIYIWHQFFIAFYRYIIGNELQLLSTIIFVFLFVILTFLSYKFFENKRFINKLSFKISIVVIFLLTTVSAFLVYERGGIVRDVPELNISKANPEKNLNVKYCDRVYSYNKDFEKNGKINVLVLGDSYGRDVANIILESEARDRINLSYWFGTDKETDNIFLNRVEECDYLFYSTKGKIEKDEYSEKLLRTMKNPSKFFIVGTKTFGYNNGCVYNKRHKNDYFEIKVKPDKNIIEDLEQEYIWENRLIDLMSYVTDEKGLVKVFTDDKKFISQDTLHLTQAGAKYFAKLTQIGNMIK